MFDYRYLFKMGGVAADFPPRNQAIAYLNICRVFLPIVEDFCKTFFQIYQRSIIHERMSVLEGAIKGERIDSLRLYYDNNNAPELFYYGWEGQINLIGENLTEGINCLATYGVDLVSSNKLKSVRGYPINNFCELLVQGYAYSFTGKPDPETEEIYNRLEKNEGFQEVMFALDSCIEKARAGDLVSAKSFNLTSASVGADFCLP